ncbi:MAG: hypothetical protein AVDCRST_MAG57-1265, partial [uncultured Blastococcus sp.]
GCRPRTHAHPPHRGGRGGRRRGGRRRAGRGGELPRDPSVRPHGQVPGGCRRAGGRAGHRRRPVDTAGFTRDGPRPCHGGGHVGI